MSRFAKQILRARSEALEMRAATGQAIDTWAGAHGTHRPMGGDISVAVEVSPTTKASPGPMVEGGPHSAPSQSYLPVQSVRRALQLLRLLNELGVAPVKDLARETGLPKATVVRMLETLMSDGYVVRDDCLGGYTVTSEVKALSAGRNVSAELLEIARKHGVALANKVGWPVNLGTLVKDRVTVHFSTSPISCWSYPFTVIGQQLDPLTSALGRIHLAFSSESSRAGILKTHFRDREIGETGRAIELSALVAGRVRAAGYSVSVPVKPKARHRFIALPLRRNARLIAAIGCGFYASAIPTERYEEEIIRPLQTAARNIETEWA